MKMFIRIMVGIILALVAIGCLTLMGKGHVWIISIPACIISAVSLHEIQGISGCKNKVLTACNMIYAGLLPFYIAFQEQIESATIKDLGKILTGLYIIAMLILMLKMYDTTKFENVAMGIFASIAIPYSISTLMLTFKFLLTKYSDRFSTSMALYICLMAMYCAWLNDTFALFVGMGLGKHKMSPKISPKKTIEGALGGIIGTTAFALATWAICNKFYFWYGTIKWWMVLIFIPICCIVGMCGDLSASVIKRNYGVKDFGTLFPEHGGMMDRVDSFLFTMPFAYMVTKLIVSFTC